MRPNPTSFKLGPISVDIDEHKIRNNEGKCCPLQPKFIEVLVYLARHQSRLISREELIENVWLGNFYVGEKALTNAIWHLRQAFKKLGIDTEVIKTIRKSGYKLLMKPIGIEEFDGADSASSRKFNIHQLSVLIGLSAIAIPTLIYGLFFVEDTIEQPLPVITNITTDPGREIFPAISKDGRFLAYKWIRQGQSPDLFVKDLQQPDLPPRQMTFDDAHESAPIWSADGKSLFFARKLPSERSCEIVNLDLENKNLRKIDTCPYGGFTQLDISADGNTLAYVSRHELTKRAGIYLLNLTDSQAEAKRVTCFESCNYRDRDIAFSPNGKYIAVTRRVDNFNENIYLVHLETMVTNQLTENFRDLLGLSWHPDGQRIVFSSQHAEDRQGYVIDIKTKQLTPLNVRGFSFPRYDSLGRLFYHERMEKYQISAISMADAKIPFVEPIIVSTFSHMHPDYSTVTRQLAYVSNESGNYELWVANPDGSQRKRLTFLNSVVHYPAWSHDGKKIAFVSPKDHGFGDQLNVIEVNSGRIDHIISEFKSLGRPSWSMDDSALYSAVFFPNDVNIYRFSLNSQESKKVTLINGRYLKQMTDNIVYFSKYTNSLWRMDLRQPGLEEKVLGRQEFGNKYVWDMTDKGIYFFRDQKNEHKIEYFDFKSGSIHDQFKLPWLSDDQYGTITVADDIKKIFLTQSEFPQADIKMLDHPVLR